MASRSGADAEKSGIAARLWAAARNTVDMLTNEADNETPFRPIENTWDHSPHDEKDEEVETMDMGLKIDSVFTLPLDTYLKQHEEENISRPIEQILKVEQQAKSLAALCKPCSVVLQKIDHDLAGRHRVFYRQWKRRFDKCGYSCRNKFISNSLRPQPKTPTKTRKQYTHKQNVKNSLAGTWLGNTLRSHGNDHTSCRANVVDVKQFSNKKPIPLRDILHKKSLSKREKLRYQYLNQMPSKHKDNSIKSNTSSDQDNHLPEGNRTQAETKNKTTTPGKQCTQDTLDTLKMKVKIEPGLEQQTLPSEVNRSTFKHIKVKAEPKYEDNEYGNSTENSNHAQIHKDGRHRDSDLKLKTEPGLVSPSKKHQDDAASEDTPKYSTLKGILGTTAAQQSKKVANFREKYSSNSSRTETSKSKSTCTTTGELTINVPKASVSFSPYKSKVPVKSKPTDDNKTFNTSSAAQANQNIQNRSSTVPLVQNVPLFLTNTNQVSSPQVPLQYVLTGVNAAGTQNPSQVILAGSNSISTPSSARLVLTGLSAPLGAVLTGANATGTQNQTVMLTNSNQLTSTASSQIVLTTANRPPSSQSSQLILTNGNANGAPRLVLANTNPNLPVTQSAQHIVLTNANQAVPNQGQQQLVYANMYTNPNQTNVAQTGQIVLNKIVQQFQPQPNLLSIPSSPQIQPQTITGAQVKNSVPRGQEPPIKQPAIPTIPAIPQRVPVIQTANILPSTTNFPPGTLFFKQNPLPDQTPQSGLQALTKLMAEKNKQSTTVVNSGPKTPENVNSQPTLPFQGKTVIIGNQKYILVPTVSQDAPAETSVKTSVNAETSSVQTSVNAETSSVQTSVNAETSSVQTSVNVGVNENNADSPLHEFYSKLAVAKKMKLLLERNEASKNQEQALTSQSNNSTSSKTTLNTSIHSESPALDTASVINEAKRIPPTNSHETSSLSQQTDPDDVICIDDTDVVPVDIVQNKSTYPRKRNPRKSKPQPRLDYDEFLKTQQKSKQKWKEIYSSDENESTDTDVDIESVDFEPEMAGKGMLIPKTPTMPPGLYQWPDGATIGEKSITLPPSLLQNMDVPVLNDNTQ